MSRALSFMADPALAASVLPGPGEGFDIPAFLREAGTVYMIAEAVSEEAPVAPLFAAMATEIHYAAAQTGQASASGRLDPPLLMGLDEVTQICPVPLPSWLSDSGGKGIQVFAVVHGEAQLAERWGDHGRQVVLDTSSVKVFLPGITDTTTLQAASTLCGQASWKVRGQDHATRHDVATPDMIRQLPAGFALVIRGGCAPVIARLPRAWKNPAYRRARRLGRTATGPPPSSRPPPWSRASPSPITCPPNGFPATTPPTPGADHATRPPHRGAGTSSPATVSRSPRLTGQLAELTGLIAQLTPGRHRPRRPVPARPGPALVETRGRRPRRTPRPAARLGRAGLPPRLRPPGRHPGLLLGSPRPVPVRPGHRGRPVVGPVPPAGPHPRAGLRPGRVPGPHPARAGRPAPGRNRPLQPPPYPRPRPEHAMTDDHPPPGPRRRRPRLAGVPLPARPQDPRHHPRLPRRHHRPAADHRMVHPPPRPEPGHRHRRSRPRRPGRRPARPGRQRLRAPSPGCATPACSRAPAITSAPPAAACTCTSPAPPSATATSPTATWTSAPQAATSWPRPPRWTVTPTSSCGPPAGTAPWTGPPRPASCNPAASRSPQPHPDQGRDLGPLAAWVAAQPEGNRNAGLYWAANRALEADPAADLSPLAAAARQAGLGEPEITRTLDSARRTSQPRPGYQAEAGDRR